MGLASKLPDPERCRTCGRKAKITHVSRHRGYKKRRHWCKACDISWSSYQTRLHPKRITARPRTA